MREADVEETRIPSEVLPSADFNDIFLTWDELRKCQELQDLLDTSVRIARKRTGSQAASIFLFSKAGVLQRRSIDGCDWSGEPIPRNWYTEEEYRPGESFTGKVVATAAGSGFGRPQMVRNLDHEHLNPEPKARYTAMLGTLRSAAAVPLNGRNHTYGVLEIINKAQRSEGNIAQPILSDSDIHWLSLIGIITAAAITILRNNDRLALLAHISQTTTRPFLEHEDPHVTYEMIAEELTGSLSSYKACIIRVGTSLDVLEVTARAGDNVAWHKRTDVLDSGKGIYSTVFASGEPQIIGDVESELARFAHADWIRENHLKSFACFPLAVKRKVFGTLSLYTGYRHTFDKTETDFLSNIAFLLACLGEAFHAVGALALDDIQVSDEHARILSGSRIVSHDRLITELRHSHKRFLVNLRSALEGINQDVGGRAGRVLDSQIKSISSEVNSILDQFASASHAKVNVNQIIQAVAKSYTRELKSKHIKCELNLSVGVPDIKASEAEIRDAVVNLLTNAIRAIEKARQRNGEITISTSVSKQSKKELLEISVEDNGIGIRNEDKPDIFKYGFSRYENGSGVGLFVTNGIVANYDGEIEVDSTVGKGSSFTIKLPVKRLRMEDE